MPKSDLATVVVGLVVAVIGYLMVDQSAGREVVNWLRQEIRKDMPHYRPMGHPNYVPVVPNRGL